MTDFTTICDNTLSVSFLRRTAGGDAIEIASALKRSERIAEDPAISSGYTVAEATFHLSKDSLETPPEVRDQLLDAQSKLWTITEVQTSEATERWICRVRCVTLTPATTETCQMQEYVYSKDADGATVRTTRNAWLGPVSITLAERRRENGRTLCCYNLAMLSDYATGVHHFFALDDGTVLRVSKSILQDPLTGLQVVEAVNH